MIVVDASAMIDALVGRDVDDSLWEALAGDVAAPHLLDIEVLSVLRGLELGGKLSAGHPVTARQDYFDLFVTRHEAAPLAERVWDTCDAKLASGGHEALVVVHPRST